MTELIKVASTSNWKPGKGWHGVDLDGTLAIYTTYQGGEIGKPIPLMVSRVKQWLHNGEGVKIFTARAALNDVDDLKKIQAWCVKYIGQALEITNAKDPDMIDLWDDRAVQVIPNTGVRVDSLVPKKETT